MEDIIADSFTLFHLIQPKIGESVTDFSKSCMTAWHVPILIDLIVLGTGTRVEQLDSAILKALKRKGLNLEIQDTVEYTDVHFNIM